MTIPIRSHFKTLNTGRIFRNDSGARRQQVILPELFQLVQYRALPFWNRISHTGRCPLGRAEQIIKERQAVLNDALQNIRSVQGKDAKTNGLTRGSLDQ